MLTKSELEMVLIDAVKQFETKHGGPGIERDTIYAILAEVGGDKHDYYKVMEMTLTCMMEGWKLSRVNAN